MAEPEFKRDPHNVNQGTDRGRETIKRSLKNFGFGRPVFAAADGTYIGGNHAMEASAEVLNLDDAIIVHSDGTKPIIHVRDDIPNASDPKFLALAILDNRTNQLNFNPDLERMQTYMQETQVAPQEVGYTVEELRVVPEELPQERSEAPSGLGDGYGVFIECRDEEEQRRAYQMAQSMGFKVRLSMV